MWKLQAEICLCPQSLNFHETITQQIFAITVMNVIHMGWKMKKISDTELIQVS